MVKAYENIHLPFGLLVKLHSGQEHQLELSQLCLLQEPRAQGLLLIRKVHWAEGRADRPRLETVSKYTRARLFWTSFIAFVHAPLVVTATDNYTMSLSQE